VTSLKRSAVAPDIPTFAESGFPGFEAVPWFGLMAPAGTPPEIIDKVYKETIADLALPDVRKAMGDQGLDIIGNTPAEFDAVLKKEIPQWAKVIKDANIKISN
jgi:tripartite-type tricarboxylate transporter receptor subunit TctC